ncbi:MAG: heme-binding protein [Victivallaceae bacterium]
MRRKILSLLVVLSAVATLFGCNKTPEQYQPSATKQISFKTIPAGKQIKTTLNGNYFTQDEVLFRRLFSYLEDNKLSMTVPVVATIGATSGMAFYIKPAEYAMATKSTGKVTVIDTPEQLVAILACSGNNNQEKFNSGVEELKTQLKKYPQYAIDGEFFVTYWDAPFWPSFMRHYEITVPVKLISQDEVNHE